LQTNISKRSQRAGARSPIASDTSNTVSVDSHSLQDSEHAFQVVVFKKLTNQLVPKGIDSESLVNFFSSQVTFGNAKERNEFEAATKYQIATPNYHVLCITALVYDPVQKIMIHAIVGAALYMHDNKNGSFIFTLGVLDRGDPQVCSLTDKHFSEHPGASSSEPFLSPNARFRQKGLATYMLSLIQVLGSIRYSAPTEVDPTGSYSVPCDEKISDVTEKKHHLYLQARIEAYSAYTYYVRLGFQLVSHNNVDFHCVNYNVECPVNQNRAPQLGYYTDNVFQRLLSMKQWIMNVYPPESHYTTDEQASPTLWGVHNLKADQFLSSALVTPNSSATLRLAMSNRVFSETTDYLFLFQNPGVDREVFWC
jgi:hypothetical protein